MALLPPFFLDTVIAIGLKKIDGSMHWLGTGFLYGDFVGKNESDESLYNFYLITNKHVLKDQTSIVIKINSHDTAIESKDYSINLFDKDNNPIFEPHPNSNVDIVALEIDANFLKNDNMSFNCFASDKHVLDRDGLANEEVSEGDNVYILGFPMGLVNQEKKYVICRQGCIARIRDYIDKRTTDFLIDGTVFPGNSGGPVVLRPELTSIEGTKAKLNASLIGVVKGYLTYEDIAISQQTQKPRITFQENSGLTSVEPVEHIIETINIFKSKKSSLAR